jgi:hypothetical protein
MLLVILLNQKNPCRGRQSNDANMMRVPPQGYYNDRLYLDCHYLDCHYLDCHLVSITHGVSTANPIGHQAANDGREHNTCCNNCPGEIRKGDEVGVHLKLLLNTRWCSEPAALITSMLAKELQHYIPQLGTAIDGC